MPRAVIPTHGPLMGAPSAPRAVVVSATPRFRTSSKPSSPSPRSLQQALATVSMAHRFHHRVLEEIGLSSLWSSTLDTKLLCMQRFARHFAYGGVALILVAYLDELSISKTRIGLFMTLTLVGDIIISLFLTAFADGLGRKATLALGALLMSASGVAFALSGNYWVLLLAAIFGVISPRYVTF